jgi:hypothetical protein
MTTEIKQESPAVSASPVGTLIQIFSEPSKAFVTIKTKGMVWFPLILTILGMVGLYFYYFKTVDFAWMIERMYASNPNKEASEMAAKVMTRDMMLYSIVGGTVIMLPIMFSISALYFLIVSKVKKFDLSFGNWFTFVAWASVPMLVLIPLGIMQIMLSHQGQLGIEQLNPTSLNQLIFHIAPGQPWQAFFDAINLPMIWSMILSVIGYQVWTKSTRASAIVIVLSPYAVVFGIWAVIGLMGK